MASQRAWTRLNTKVSFALDVPFGGLICFLLFILQDLPRLGGVMVYDAL